MKLMANSQHKSCLGKYEMI